MKNLSKKKYIFLLIALGIFLWILIHWLIKSDAEKMVISCRDVYKQVMKLQCVTVDENNKNVSIKFEMKDGYIPRTQDDIAETYQTIINTFIYDNTQYKNYSINLHFIDIEEVIAIFNITQSLDSVKFASNTCINMKDIPRLFPYISKLYLDPANYNDITDIEGFLDLEYVYFSQGITSDEVNYILSLYPNCEIDEQGDLQEV